VLPNVWHKYKKQYKINTKNHTLNTAANNTVELQLMSEVGWSESKGSHSVTVPELQDFFRTSNDFCNRATFKFRKKQQLLTTKQQKNN